MIVTTLRAAGDGGCSTPVQIGAQLPCEEEEGFLRVSPSVDIGIPLCHSGRWSRPMSGTGGSRGLFLPSRQWPGTTRHHSGRPLASPPPTSAGAHGERRELSFGAGVDQGHVPGALVPRRETGTHPSSPCGPCFHPGPLGMVVLQGPPK